MDDHETTFDERVTEVRNQRRVGRDVADRAQVDATDLQKSCAYPGCSEPTELFADYCPDHPGRLGATKEFDPTPARPFGGTGLTSENHADSTDEVEQLRRDVSRLEGKIDALLAALEVSDGDV